MDIATAPADIAHATLSYDDSVPYEDQLPTASLAERIGSTKVYLLSEASSKAAARLGKFGRQKKKGDTEEEEAEDEMEIDHDPTIRANAILLNGPPISHLPTARLFEYAAHFEVHPLGMEWIDDTTCIFVFSSKAAARSAFYALRKPRGVGVGGDGESDSTELMTARAIPVSLWPPEDRIHQSLGVGHGLKGTMNIRWARVDDKKKRGAKNDSAFYKKHGLDAGKESAGFGVVPSSGTAGSLARRMGPIAEEEQPSPELEDGVREWDRGKPGVGKSSSSSSSLTPLETRISSRKRQRDDVDEFLGDDLNDDPPPSKMRSDYIAQDGRTVIEGKRPELEGRAMAPLPRRARGGRGGREGEGDEENRMRGRRRRGREPGSSPLRKKTRQELDDELDAFLNKD